MNNLIVCKIGGSIVEGVHPTIIEDIKALQGKGNRIVIVHGGGDQVTMIAEKLGKKQEFITSPDGIQSRYTDKETADIFTMVMGMIGKQITQAFQRNGIDALSLCGIDSGLLRAVRKKKLIVKNEQGRKVAIEGGYTGKIGAVNTELLDSLLSASIVPVVSPVAAGEEWEFLNVDGDRACSHIAGALKAKAAIFLTDTDGLLLNGHVVERIKPVEAKEALRSAGPGMDKKVIAAVEAIELGAERSVIASGLVKNPIRNALEGHGTVISS